MDRGTCKARDTFFTTAWTRDSTLITTMTTNARHAEMLAAIYSRSRHLTHHRQHHHLHYTTSDYRQHASSHEFFPSSRTPPRRPRGFADRVSLASLHASEKQIHRQTIAVAVSSTCLRGNPFISQTAAVSSACSRTCRTARRKNRVSPLV